MFLNCQQYMANGDRRRSLFRPLAPSFFRLGNTLRVLGCERVVAFQYNGGSGGGGRGVCFTCVKLNFKSLQQYI